MTYPFSLWVVETASVRFTFSPQFVGALFQKDIVGLARAAACTHVRCKHTLVLYIIHTTWYLVHCIAYDSRVR